MRFMRVGDKVISLPKINRIIQRVMDMRAKGYSQREIGQKLDLERSFISRLESLGQVRRGDRIALVGFPVGNKEAVYKLAKEQGIDFVFILTEEERWSFIKDRDGLSLFNEVLRIIKDLQEFEVIIFLGSDMRIEIVESLLEGEVISLPLGPSPIRGDVIVDVDELKSIIEQVKLGGK